MKRDIRYQLPGRRRRMSRRLLLLGGVLAVFLIVGSVVVHRRYNANLQPVSSDRSSQYVTIAQGTSTAEIGELLSDKHLIRSSEAFQWYVNSHNQRDKLQAGTYRFSPSMSTPRIVTMIVNGEITSDLVTILSGQTIAEVRKTFISAGFNVNEVDMALRADQYRSFPALADNPSTATLEGFLYPDSYQKTADTNPREVIEEALNEMQQHVTADMRKSFAAQGLSVYQGITLASIVEKEVSNPADRPQVAQVFLKRLNQGMRLGSDVTVFYADAINDPSYDTTEHKGLPPGPIGTISDEALRAVAHPAASDWLYFVTGDDGTTYFSKTFQEHQMYIDKYCHKNCKK